MYMTIVDGTPDPSTISRAAPDIPDDHPKRASIKPVIDQRAPFEAGLFRAEDVWSFDGTSVIRRNRLVARKDLDGTREDARRIIDDAADQAISAQRTQGHGIAAVYDAQRAEMMEYLARVASGQPTPGDLFPVMTALVGSSVGVDLAAVSETIRLRVTGEAQRLAAINRKRLDGKAAVAAASSVEAVAAAVAAARAQIEGA